MLLLLASERRTLSGVEETALGEHLESCATCGALDHETNESYRWLVRVPESELRDTDLSLYIHGISLSHICSLATGEALPAVVIVGRVSKPTARESGVSADVHHP